MKRHATLLLPCGILFFALTAFAEVTMTDIWRWSLIRKPDIEPLKTNVSAPTTNHADRIYTPAGQPARIDGAGGVWRIDTVTNWVVTLPQGFGYNDEGDIIPPPAYRHIIHAANGGTAPINLLGLAMSGGGIRSAAFQLGILSGMHSTNFNGRTVLEQVDYISSANWMNSTPKLCSLPRRFGKTSRNSKHDKENRGCRSGGNEKGRGTRRLCLGLRGDQGTCAPSPICGPEVGQQTTGRALLGHRANHRRETGR